MGRHTAGDGAAVHPLVAAALERRAPVREEAAPEHGTAGLAAVQPGAQHEEGPLGWPGQPGDGTGLGWPADPRPASSALSPVASAEPARRRGWRRLFGRAA